MEHVGDTTEWDSKIQGYCSCVSTIGQNLQSNTKASKLKTLEVILILRFLRHTKRSRIQYNDHSFSHCLFILNEFKK